MKIFLQPVTTKGIGEAISWREFGSLGLELAVDAVKDGALVL